MKIQDSRRLNSVSSFHLNKNNAQLKIRLYRKVNAGEKKLEVRES